MPLSCVCSDDGGEPGDHLWYIPDDYRTLETRRRQRCCSCKELIDLGAVVAEVPRFKVPDTDVECEIYGDDGEILLASHYLCEVCADLYFSLTELHFCVDPHENQRELVKEYSALYGPEKQSEETIHESNLAD